MFTLFGPRQLLFVVLKWTPLAQQLRPKAADLSQAMAAVDMAQAQAQLVRIAAALAWLGSQRTSKSCGGSCVGSLRTPGVHPTPARGQPACGRRCRKLRPGRIGGVMGPRVAAVFEIDKTNPNFARQGGDWRSASGRRRTRLIEALRGRIVARLAS